jgi:hypothetical protein
MMAAQLDASQEQNEISINTKREEQEMLVRYASGRFLYS